MPTKLEDINTCVRNWINAGLGIALNKIVISNQNKKLPTPPFVFLHIDDSIERVGFIETVDETKKYYESLFKVTVLIEVIGLTPLTHSISSWINKLESFYQEFKDKDLGVVRDEINVISVPNYFEEGNEIMKHIVSLPIYYREVYEVNRVTGDEVRFNTNISHGGGSTDNPFAATVLLEGEMGDTSEGFGAEVTLQGVMGDTDSLIEATISLEGTTGIPEYPIVEVDTELPEGSSTEGGVQTPTPPTIVLSDITATGVTITCT
jgi:hypothetical protein